MVTGPILFQGGLGHDGKPSMPAGFAAKPGRSVANTGCMLNRPDITSRRVRERESMATKARSACAFIAASVAAESVFCGDDCGRIQRRDLMTGQVTANLDRQLGAVGELTVSRDGTVLTAVGGAIPGVSRWRLDGAGAVTAY